jgi:ATP synthase protein I
VVDGDGQGAGIAPKGAKLAAPPVHRVTVVQLAVLGILYLVTFRLVDADAAGSLVAGGLCNALPQVWFALVLYGSRRRSPRTAAGVAYAAEAGKFALSAAGFALVFALLRPVVAPAVFGGFAAMLFVQIAGGIWLLRRGQGSRAN